ncbi:MAG: efflux RND transporter periplasmic adaptor subunit [Bryobacteraceae bacterium]
MPTKMHATTPATLPPGDTTQAQSGAIFVAPEKQQLIGMRSVAAEYGALAKEIRAVGKVGYDETRVTHIHTKVSGYIEEVFADFVGKPVRAGEPLFTIYSPDLVATEQDFLLALRSRVLLRDTTLASAATGSENLIAAARERLRLWDVTDSEIRDLETSAKIKRAITVYSPVSGVIAERAAYHHGAFVDPAKDLFTIVDLSRVWVQAEIYEADLPFVRKGQTAAVDLPYAGQALRGRVDFISPFLDPKTRTVQVRIEFPNPGLMLKPEMFTNVRLKVPLGRQLLVPQDAVMDTGVEQYVFIDLGNGYIQPRSVKVSAASGDKVGVGAGLKAGEKVVTAANFVIDSDSQLKGAFADMGKPSTRQAAQPRTSTQNISVEVLEPATAKTGRNAIRLRIKDAAGNPITGAQVEVALNMPQMGSMPPMSSHATLAESGGGIYAGQIEFQMAWTWQTTVTVRRNESLIGVAKTTITSR